MGDWKNPVNSGESRSDKKSGVPQVKDGLILFGWIAGLILIASLCWFLTQPIRSRFLLRAVNHVLEESGDTRRLGEPISPSLSGSIGVGAWYTMTQAKNPLPPVLPSARRTGDMENAYFSEGTRAFIFTFIGEGTFFPCAAVVAPGGEVKEFIPLSSQGERMIKQISPGVLKIYARRIEGDKS